MILLETGICIKHKSSSRTLPWDLHCDQCWRKEIDRLHANLNDKSMINQYGIPIQGGFEDLSLCKKDNFSSNFSSTSDQQKWKSNLLTKI